MPPLRKSLVNVRGKPSAEFLVPGHPLVNTVSDLTLERHKNLLTQGAVLVDETDPGTELRALFYLEHTVQDGRKDRNGNPLTLSKQLHFVELAADGTARSAGYAPLPRLPSPRASRTG